MHAHFDKTVDSMANEFDIGVVKILFILLKLRVELSGEPTIEPPTEPTNESTFDIHVFGTYLNDILNENDVFTKYLRDECRGEKIYSGVRTFSKYNRVATKVYLFQKKKENIDKTYEKLSLQPNLGS